MDKDKAFELKGSIVIDISEVEAKLDRLIAKLERVAELANNLPS